jgi:hypothetical protein
MSRPEAKNTAPNVQAWFSRICDSGQVDAACSPPPVRPPASDGNKAEVVLKRLRDASFT